MGKARILFADSLFPCCITIDWISMKNYLTRLQNRCGKPKSFTMAPTIYPRLPSVMKGIRHKAEVWLSRESKQARTPFWSASFLMSCRGAKRLAEKEREREKHFGRVISKRKEKGSQAKRGTGLPRWRRLVHARYGSSRCIVSRRTARFDFH